jgi:hypothetical protein
MRSLVALAVLAALLPAFAAAQDADPRWAGRRPAPAPGHSLDLMLGDPHARRVAPRTDFDGGSYRPAEARRPAPATPPRTWRPRDVESRPLAPGQAD